MYFPYGGDAALEALAASLPHSQLQSLALGYTTDAAAGVHALADVLPSAVLLRKLDLNSCQGMSGEALAALAEALPQSQLEDLDLSNGEFEAVDFWALVDALENSSTRLRRVHVSEKLDRDRAMDRENSWTWAEESAHDRAWNALQTAAGSSWWVEEDDTDLYLYERLGDVFVNEHHRHQTSTAYKRSTGPISLIGIVPPPPPLPPRPPPLLLWLAKPSSCIDTFVMFDGTRILFPRFLSPSKIGDCVPIFAFRNSEDDPQ